MKARGESDRRTHPAKGPVAGRKVRALPVEQRVCERTPASRTSPRPRRRVYLAMLAVLALTVVSLVLTGPIKRNMQASAELRSRQQELEVEKEETRDLQERRDRALQTDFIIKQARRLGYVMRGEIPVILVREGEAGEKPLQ